jgi:hypothetical protein
VKGLIWTLGLIFSILPAFGQDPEETLLQLRIGAVFADGNLALRDIQAENHPVRQMKRFFDDAKLRLSSAQERDLNAIVDAQMLAVSANAQNEEAVRRINQEYTAKFYNVLTPDQRTALRRYRTDQIMMYGGFPALKLVMDNAKTPLTAEQDKQARALYDEFYQQFKQMPRDSKGAADRLQLDKAENETLAKVVRLLTPEQRRALAASRQAGSLNRR